MSNHDADLIIAGAGCAGLSALSRALEVGVDRRIVVVDRDLEPSDDRTWAFWGSRSAPFAHLADRRWDRIEVGFPSWRTTQTVDPLARTGADRRSYLRVRRRDYDREILDLAALVQPRQKPQQHVLAQILRLAVVVCQMPRKPQQGRSQRDWRFATQDLARAQSALRLRRDLGVNPAGAALAIDLIDEMERLRERVRVLETLLFQR